MTDPSNTAVRCVLLAGNLRRSAENITHTSYCDDLWRGCLSKYDYYPNIIPIQTQTNEFCKRGRYLKYCSISIIFTKGEKFPHSYYLSFYPLQHQHQHLQHNNCHKTCLHQHSLDKAFILITPIMSLSASSSSSQQTLRGFNYQHCQHCCHHLNHLKDLLHHNQHQHHLNAHQHHDQYHFHLLSQIHSAIVVSICSTFISFILNIIIVFSGT